MAEPAITFYPASSGNTVGFADSAVDVWNDEVEPQLGFTITAWRGPTVPSHVGGDYDNFLDWLNSENYIDKDGQCHIYVLDEPFGGDSFGAGSLADDSDSFGIWNAGKGNLVSDAFNENIAIMEPSHTMMFSSLCPGDNYSNSDDHTCGTIRYGQGPSGSDEVTPMITSYLGQVGDSCNGATDSSQPFYVTDLSSCTKYSMNQYYISNW